MIGRGPPPSVRSVTGTTIDGRALHGQILTDSPHLLTQHPHLGHAIVMLTLSTSIRAILSHLNRRHPLTDLPRELVQVITQVRPVVIRHLLPSGLSSLMHCINPALETGRERF